MRQMRQNALPAGEMPVPDLEPIAEATTLRMLANLAWNNIRQGSSVALAASVKVNEVLCDLNIEYNNLGVDGVRTRQLGR